MAKFYFTYGSSSDIQPYQGGWTEVKAEDMDQAIGAFNAVHPMKNKTIVCASIYTEEQFKATSMGQKGSNLGAGLQETIELKVKAGKK